MSVLDVVLAAFGLQRAETSEERKELDRLAYCTASRAEYLLRLHQAVLIAQAGGISDEKLEALLHLGVVGTITPPIEEALRAVEIDPRPCRRDSP